VGKVLQPLQSVNYHDSHAHGYGWDGSGLVYLGQVGLVRGM
jgi:hypothetical protein